MADQWIVRVQGKEYGPVDLEELREWKREGRLIRENEIRGPESDRWIRAGELPEIFAEEKVVEAEPPPLVRRLGFAQISSAGWRIYRAGFGRFFILSLLLSVPSFFLQVAAPFLEMPKPGVLTTPVMVSAAVVFITIALLVIAWPFSIAATQLLAADLYAGRSPGVRDLLGRSKPLWTRLFILGLMVYGSYLLWTILPALFAVSLVASSSSFSSLILALLLLLFTAYMVLRLFINFLFWQQAGALGDSSTVTALQESRDLARSGQDRPKMERPLYRGAIFASVWLLLIIVLNLAVEMPVALYHFRNVTSIEQATAMMQSIARDSSPDVLSIITTLVSCLINALLRPWLAAVFVVLYLDTKARVGRNLPND